MSIYQEQENFGSQIIIIEQEKPVDEWSSTAYSLKVNSRIRGTMLEIILLIISN